MCFISNVMVNLKNPLTAFTTLITLPNWVNVAEAGEVGETESGITSVI
jgi:hypothetical protein